MSDQYFSYKPTKAEQDNFARYSWRSPGATPSESYLKSLCESSFLRFWTYAGVFRKQSDGIAKEVCDVIAVFDDDIIVFSDKDCSWPQSPNLNVNWLRWEKRAITKSINQLRGAHRLIERDESSLYLDEKCSIEFPYPLPNSPDRKIHLVAVARGAAAACRSYFQGGTGTLALLCDPDNRHLMPFAIGAQLPTEPFVHVFDEVGMELLFEALNTAKDFTAYLNARKELLTRGDTVIAQGEEDILALYFAGDSDSPWRGAFPPNPGAPAILEVPPELWESMAEFFDERKKLERVGFLWDHIIDEMIDSITSGKLYFAYPATMEGQERVIRYLARESRGRRIQLAHQLYGLIQGTPIDQRTFRSIPSATRGESTFVYLVTPRHPETQEEVYRVARREMLLAYCRILKLKYPYIQTVVGIASEPANPISSSFDILAMDLTDWSEEDAAEAEEVRRRTGFMAEYKEWRMSEEEASSLREDDVIFPGPKATPYHPTLNRSQPKSAGGPPIKPSWVPHS